jgi:hypothetical protein
MEELNFEIQYKIPNSVFIISVKTVNCFDEGSVFF